jgi:phosphatidate phosphatase APP1
MREKSTQQRLRIHERSRLKAPWQPPRDAVVLHSAFGTGSNAVIEGRVIDYEDRGVITPADRKLANLRRNLGLLFNDERVNVPVRVRLRTHEWQTTTDAEGYFRIEATNLATLAPGWHRIQGSAGDATDEAGLLMVPPQNTRGIISDIDDTVLITEVGSKHRMLINTLLHNPLQRRVVEGVAQLYHKLSAANPVPEATPLFYLSATPRQLHLSLQAILEHNRFPRGVLITKRVTNDATSEPLRDQFAYKTRKIVQILERLPHVNFTLIGDNVERDPDIFESLRSLYPARIIDIWIRRVDKQAALLATHKDLDVLLRS